MLTGPSEPAKGGATAAGCRPCYLSSSARMRILCERRRHTARRAAGTVNVRGNRAVVDPQRPVLTLRGSRGVEFVAGTLGTRAAGSDVERGPFVDALDLGAMSVRL